MKFIELNINDFVNYKKIINNIELTVLVLINPKHACYMIFDDVFILIYKILWNSAIKYKDNILNLYHHYLKII